MSCWVADFRSLTILTQAGSPTGDDNPGHVDFSGILATKPLGCRLQEPKDA